MAGILANNDDQKVIAGLDILHKLIQNILKNPTDQKYRILKKTNKTIQQKLLGLNPSGIVMELIEAFGYIQIDEEQHAFAGDYFAVLMEGSQIVDAETMKLKMKYMSEEEKAKQELIQKNREEYKAKAKADAEYKRQLEELSQKERKVKQAEKNQEGKANQIKFGANLVKFEPPAQQRGG